MRRLSAQDTVTVIVGDAWPRRYDTTWTGTRASSSVAWLWRLWGIPHKRHYADGWVMCPAVAFPLLGAEEPALQSA